MFDIGGATVFSQVFGLSCGHCRKEQFRVGINLEDDELIMICVGCNKPTVSGAKLTSEARANVLDQREKLIANRPGMGAN